MKQGLLEKNVLNLCTESVLDQIEEEEELIALIRADMEALDNTYRRIRNVDVDMLSQPFMI